MLPLFGVALWFPGDTASPTGEINYRSTETLYFDEYWYEYEYITTGNIIEYSVQSSSGPISYAIYDSSFYSLPTTIKTGEIKETITIQPNNYEYVQLYLRSGSMIQYNYTASDKVDFFIVDGDNFNEWNQYGNPWYYELRDNMTSASGIENIYMAKDYYIVWYDEGSSDVSVTYDIDYSAANVVDFSQAFEVQENVNSVSGSFTVPSSGDWYFFVYFDPMYNPAESETITFDVTYNTGVTSTSKWLAFLPIMIIIVVIIVIIIVAAVIARRSQKKMKAKADKEKPKEEAKKAAEKKKCASCGAEAKPGAKYCQSCGKKLEGRDVGGTTKTIPAKSKVCTYCGSDISPTHNFCRYCGAKVEK